MIGSKHITAICCLVTALAIAFTCLLMSGLLPVAMCSISAEDSRLKYVDTLFDTSYVHSLNITVDENNWQEMLDNAMAEEYIACDVTIDGTTMKNVAIRPKGNTSLSRVQSMDSERYSFKIKFNKYNEDTTYNGLDKLALNNIIQDNTYMKDYFSYRMMAEAGAEAPLCSFIYIKVNNEDWGLYLAVEAIEEAFAERNYGNDHGEIYKPESIAMGGGMGNHNGGQPRVQGRNPGGINRDDEAPQTPDFESNTETTGQSQMTQGERGGGVKNGNRQPQQVPDGERTQNGGQSQKMTSGKMSQNGGQTQGTSNGKANQNSGQTQETPNDGMMQSNGAQPETPGAGRGGFGGGPGGWGSDAVALVYQGDAPDSYSAIFDYSVFDIDESDKKRLISSIKQLNEGENLDEVVNVDEVLRYFAAHNFTVSSDSYTGNMKHNYYLHESDGQMSMIAWDYNLAFGGMGGMGGKPGANETNQSMDSSTKYVNYPIDTPLFDASFDERPMLGRLLENEEYMALYHEVFDEFIANYFENGDFVNEYNRVFNMIAEYVQKDPTKFCTFDAFLTGSDNLKQFCILRAESVRGQLDGTIPSTDEGQSADSSALVDASSVDVDSMGDMGMGGMDGQRRENREDNNDGSEKAFTPADKQPLDTETDNRKSAAGNMPEGRPGNEMFNTSRLAQMLDMDEAELEEMSEDGIRSLLEEKINNGELNMSPRGDSVLGQTDNTAGYMLLGGSLLIILLAIVFAARYKRRRF